MSVDLHALGLDEFVAARDAEAKRLRADGRRDDAAAVAKLRKPSVAAWAVNTLVREQPDAFAALLASGDELVAAQGALLAGDGDSRSLRAARDAEQRAVDALVAAAAKLTSAGKPLGATITGRIADTLHAAALDGSARQQVAGGQLEKELAHAGLGLAGMEAFAAQAPPRKPKRASRTSPKTRDDADGEPTGEQQRREKQARREERERRKRAAAELRCAERDARGAERDRDAAQAQRDSAAETLAAAEEALAAAAERADDAHATLERARASAEP